MSNYSPLRRGRQTASLLSRRHRPARSLHEFSYRQNRASSVTSFVVRGNGMRRRHALFRPRSGTRLGHQEYSRHAYNTLSAPMRNQALVIARQRTTIITRRLQAIIALLRTPSFNSNLIDRIDGSRTLRPQDTSATQNWCRSLRRITSGAVSHRNCPGLKCPGFSSITALVSKCLVIPRYWCRSVLRPVPKCPRVSWCRSVLWPKWPVTISIPHDTNGLKLKK